MWSGGGGGMPPPSDVSSEENARLALNALAAYSTTAATTEESGVFAGPRKLGPRQYDDVIVAGINHAQEEEEGVGILQDNVQPQQGQALAKQEEESSSSPIVVAPRGKPEAMAKALGEARLKREREEKKTPTKKKKKKKSSPASRSKKFITMDDPVAPIQPEEYQNLDNLMEQFCKVPLLSEFSRPVALLHPELLSTYSKIVTHPVDMGKVCRAIRRRQYLNTRDVRLDLWRIFCNCCKYHVRAKNGVPSFCSISLHLREYFNALWQEYMLPSDGTKKEFTKREEDRIKRIKATSATYMSDKALEKTAAFIREFLNNGGRVDALDQEGIDSDDDDDFNVVLVNLQRFQRKVLQIASQDNQQDYTVLEFVTDFRKCMDNNDLLLQDKPSLRNRFKNRLERILGKIICPIYEANGRGVNQSSIWGCMAAAIWARESSKKPYWPALVLGILAPHDQREDWHASLTNRNEERLPEKLRSELQSGKRKAEQALKRQSQGTAEQQSFFLVEFMGTHEFIWVKEADIIESFDPDDDPNQNVAAGSVTKKKRSSRVSGHDVLKSKTYATAIEEARWALEEFEMQLNDTCGDLEEVDQEDGEEQGYSYSVLCQSDDEAEEAQTEMTIVDIEESNELLATDGLLDFTVAGRKEAKRRVAARRKQKADAAKKEKAEQAKKQKLAAKKRKRTGGKGGGKGHSEQKKLEKELERKRRKRGRERERILREELRKKKRRRPDASDKGIPDKRQRANAIVKGYLTRMARKDGMLGSNTFVIPTSAVDSSGLLGMALAFRAAAGEITMEDQDASFSKLKAFDKVDTTSPRTSAERIEKLQEQLALLEKEAERVKARTAKRKELTELALQEGEEIYKEILEREAQAKKSDVKKRKKYSKVGKKAAKEKQSHDEDDEPQHGEGEKAEGSVSKDTNADEEVHTTDEEAELRAEEEAHLRAEEEADFRAEEVLEKNQVELQADKQGDDRYYSADEMDVEEQGEVETPEVTAVQVADQFEDAD